MKLKPTRDYILVRPIARIKSDIVFVVSHEDACQGEVVAVGPGIPHKGKPRPLDVKVGDWVRFKFHETYQKYTEGSVEYLLIREPDVEFIMEDAA